MPAKLEEITITFLSERHRFNNADGDVIIARAWVNSDMQKEIAIKGQSDLDELLKDNTYRLFGSWKDFKAYDPQLQELDKFEFRTFVLQQPHARSGVINYLRAAGEGCNFSTGKATQCWELFGSDAVKVFREQPELVAEKLTAVGPYWKLSVDDARKIAAILKSEVALEGCTLDLMDLLNGRGFRKATARLAVRRWGNRAAGLIRQSAYRLMGLVGAGAGFKKCDSLYLDLGGNPSRLKRQALSGWYNLHIDTDGNTWHPAEKFIVGIKANVAGAELQIEKAIKLSTRSKQTALLRTDKITGPLVSDGQVRWMAEGSKAKNEADLADLICEALLEPCWWPDASELRSIDAKITDHQIAELSKALKAAIAILGGGPGCGKTWLIGLLVKLLISKLGSNQIWIGAPTGKAAIRITESLAANGLNIRARTWHSLLAALDRQGHSHFPCKVLIGDEESMKDTDLAAAVFRRRAAGTHVLLVGDVNQLSPVGHGAPLRDLIAAGLPYGQLEEIKRNDGGIAEACKQIRQGNNFTPGGNLVVRETMKPEQQISEMVRELNVQKTNGRNAIWDCQVLCIVNKKSPLARETLNKVLQSELNPNGGTDGSPFRVGDKIVCLKNSFVPSITLDSSDPETTVNDRGEVYVANGELAEVIEARPTFTVAQLNNPRRTVRIPRGQASTKTDTDSDDAPAADDNTAATGCDWDLGYALSTWKAQGSEWPVVLVMIDEYPGAARLATRELWYTNISRARELCVLIGKQGVVNRGCKVVALGKRKTFLKERILLAQVQRELAEL